VVRAALATHQRGDIDAAERGYREALELAPGHPTATHYLGVAAYQRGHLETALPLLHAAVEAAPKEAEFHNNLGLALAAADRSEEAIAAHRRALDLRPGHAATWSNLGLALQANNQVRDAIAAYRSAIGLEPEFAQAHWNLGLALLANEEFDEGWREYAWRHKVPELARLARRWPGPKWDGGSPDGLTLLVTTEQGLGDTLQFIRLARTLAARGARVLVSAQQPLVRLLASAPGVAAVYGPDEAVPAHDAHIPLIDLAGILGVTPSTIPSAVPYLEADPVRRGEIASTLEQHAGALKVGLAWSGNQRNVNERRRSIPLPWLAPLLALPDVVWYSLKRGSEETGIEAVPGAQALQRHPAREDFDGLAALVAELDLVVSVDTSIAHLGGALARPTWVLLASAADWRWQSGRLDSPWYPTVRLFRQPRAGDWEAVIRDVVAALSTGRPGPF
jgi:Flp pilus assembly protein TadD